MILLPNGCHMSEPSVYPKNWKQTSASVKKDWYIQYYFHDPIFKKSDRYKHGRLCIIKGMNACKTLIERRELTQKIFNQEIQALQDGYNPITRLTIAPIEVEYEIAPTTPFIKALYKALDKISCQPTTLLDVKSVLKYISESAAQLRYDNIPIKEIKRKHIRLLLDQCGRIKATWNSKQFNHYRKYLGILYKQLVELEAVEYNPIRDIAKQKTIQRLRETLNFEERKRINEYLHQEYYSFWRFINIFFHSGARPVELLSIKKEDVDLMNQKYKCLIKKGKQYREVWRTIKDVALPLWQELMMTSDANQYLFSKDLRPGNNKIRRDQVTRRWEMHVKKKLSINADLYSLKHTNTDETAELSSIQDAAAMNSHTTTAITLQHYAIGEKERQHQRLKQVGNKFA